jgi:hypothetical protein
MPIEHFGADGERDRRRTRKFVLLLLATWADADGGSCFPSVATIARAAGLTVRAVQQALACLRARGILQIEYKSGPRQANVYRLVVHCGSPRTAVHDTVNAGSGGGEPLFATEVNRRSPNQSVSKQIPSKDQPARKRAALLLPDWLPEEEWGHYALMRKKIRKPLTDYAIELAIRKLDELRHQGHDPAAVLNQSVLNNWTGLFPLRSENQRRPAPQEFVATDYKTSAGLAPDASAGRF